MNPVELFRKKFDTYRKVLDEAGEQQAWDALFEGYPERQRKNMSRILETKTMRLSGSGKHITTTPFPAKPPGL